MQYLSDFLKRLQLSWRLFRDDRVSYAPKAIPILVMIYVVSPLDLMPFIPVDDIDDLPGTARVRGTCAGLHRI